MLLGPQAPRFHPPDGFWSPSLHSRPLRRNTGAVQNESRRRGAARGASLGWVVFLLVAAYLALGLGKSILGNHVLGEEPPLEFDEQRAWADLEALVALGPRVAGTPGAEKAREYIEGELRAAGLEPVREEFRAATPKGPLGMANVYVDLPGATGDDASGSMRTPMVVLCTHFDTKRLPFEFVGANDGGSGTAVLLELARVLARAPRGPLTWRLLFLDGEEAIRRQWLDPDNRYGSREHVRALRVSGNIARVKACVLLDMVGDADLKLTRETYSDRELLNLFFEAARRGGHNLHVGARGQPIKDDHQSFLEADVPSVNLIDFEYGPANAYWHTADDTLEHCSAESLGIVGDIVLLALPDLEERYAQR